MVARFNAGDRVIFAGEYDCEVLAHLGGDDYKLRGADGRLLAAQGRRMVMVAVQQPSVVKADDTTLPTPNPAGDQGHQEEPDENDDEKEEF